MNIPLTVLAVFDGFGYSPQPIGNAVAQAQTPNLDYLWTTYPHFLVKAAEEEVGLSFGEIGNSEVGHISIGTGRVIPQSLSRINRAIDDGSFFQNPGLLETINKVKQNNSALHLLGLISTAGVHAHLSHYLSIMRLAAQQQVPKLYLHLILDGRDAGPKDSPFFLREIDNVLRETKLGTYASICGRGLTMDRNNNWELIEKGYRVLFGQGEHTFDTPHKAIENFYAQDIDDESMPPISIVSSGQEPIGIKPGDGLIMTNYREDRARQIIQCMSLPDFKEFPRLHKPDQLTITTMTSYENGMPVTVAFPPPSIANTFSDVLSQHQISQIHIAETEKYAHVTYFFNGGREEKTALEEFYMVPSIKPDQFALKPEMSAKGVTEAVIKAIELGYQCIVFNFANCDMVGHTGNFEAAVKAVETVDSLIKPIWDAVSAKDGYLFLTADHGNSEIMIDTKTNSALKEHTISPVPFIVCHNQLAESKPQTTKIMNDGQIAGLLSDVAPTILNILKLPIPNEMSGTSLIQI